MGIFAHFGKLYPRPNPHDTKPANCPINHTGSVAALMLRQIRKPPPAVLPLTSTRLIVGPSPVQKVMAFTCNAQMQTSASSSSSSVPVINLFTKPPKTSTKLPANPEEFATAFLRTSVAALPVKGQVVWPRPPPTTTDSTGLFSSARREGHNEVTAASCRAIIAVVSRSLTSHDCVCWFEFIWLSQRTSSSSPSRASCACMPYWYFVGKRDT